MHNKIKLLHLITGFGCGGAEKMVYQLCKYSDADKFDISVVGIDDTDYFLPELEILPIEVSKLGLNKNLYALFKGLLSLNKIIRQHEIQIIHAHLFHAMVMACMLKVFNPAVKILWTSHSSRMISIFRSLIAYFGRLFREKDIILQSHLKSWYHSSAISVIPNGIELHLKPHSLSKFKTFTFISVGSLNKMKNHIFLINLFSGIKRFNYNLLIIGTGPEEKILEDRINELGLSNKIELLGHRYDVFSLMKQSHCFLLPSLREGLPMVILESGYAKLPIVASSIISLENLISKDEGYVVPLDQFEDTIQLVVDNYVNAEAKANRFYAHVNSDYNINTCISNHEKLYGMLINA